MPKLTRRLPSYRLHKASGKAFVELNGHRHYLGVHGSEASRQEYDKLTAEWLGNGRRVPMTTNESVALTIGELIIAYFKHVEVYYRNSDGERTSEVDTIRQALRWLNKLYGTTPAHEFGPRALKALRLAMITQPPPDAPIESQRRSPNRPREPWSRSYANKQVGRIRSMFGWAVENEILGTVIYHAGNPINTGAAVHQALLRVKDLKKGRCTARETKKVKPVPIEDVEAAIAFMVPQVSAMVRLQLLTGMRPGEVVIMRTGDIDRGHGPGPRVWVYRPYKHKTEHHDIEREIRIGPKAQAVLAPFLKLDPSVFIFSPAEALQWVRDKKRAERKTKVQPSQINRAEEAAKRKHKRAPRARYKVASYRRAIERACKKAEVPRWHPHRLRHNAATDFRKRYGLDAARILLGHRTAAITEVYAEQDYAKAAEIMAEVG